MTGRHAGQRSDLSRSPGEGARGPRRGSRGTGRRGPRHPLAIGLLGLALLVALAVGWLVWSGLAVRHELSDARQATATLRKALLRGDQPAAAAALRAATTHADDARATASDPVWSMAAALPYVGRTPRAVSDVADAVATLADDVLPRLVAVGRGLDPATLRTGDQIDVTAIAAMAPTVTAASDGVRQAQAALAAISLDGVAGPVADGVRSARAQVDALGGQLAAAASATRLLPSMLGANAPRRYLVVFQNNAEARGTGGLVGAFGLVQASKGRITVVRLGSDVDLRSAAQPVVDLGPHYRALFGVDTALWPNTNLSAHFPSAAVQQLELWRRQYGERLDGVVALDPVALGYLLDATGPATLPDGERVSGGAIADLTMRAVYARYAQPSQVLLRKAYLQVVARAALDQLLRGAGNAQGELTALGRAAGERRLLVYSTHPDEERALASTAVGGVVDATPGPYAGVALDNASGSKIDYYVGRGLTYTLGACPSGTGTRRASTITVTLRDEAPAQGLPAYAAYRLDLGPVTTTQGLGGDGSVRETVLVYAAVGSELTAATIDGGSLAVTPGDDGAAPGRPVYVFSVVLAAGQSRTAVLHLTEPATSAPARSWVQPLVRAATSTVQGPTCR